MGLNERYIWIAAGIGMLVLLVITTPGWKEVLGLNFDLGFLGRYAPALILLGFMGALVAFVLVGGDKGGED